MISKGGNIAMQIIQSDIITDSYLDSIFANMFWKDVDDACDYMYSVFEDYELDGKNYHDSDAAMINALPEDVRLELLNKLKNFGKD